MDLFLGANQRAKERLNPPAQRGRFSDVRNRAWFGFYSGSVGIVNRMTTAATIGRKVRRKDNALAISFRDSNHRPHGITTESTAIQKTSTTKLDKETVDPTFDMPRGNHAMTPVNGYT